MRIGELKIGEEYAVHRFTERPDELGYTPTRAKLVDIVRKEGEGRYLGRVRGPGDQMVSRFASVSMCRFELLEPSTWQIHNVQLQVGHVVELSAKQVWRTWVAHRAKVESRERVLDEMDRIGESLNQAFATLGITGGARIITRSVNLAATQVVLTGAMVIELADRLKTLELRDV